MPFESVVVVAAVLGLFGTFSLGLAWVQFQTRGLTAAAPGRF